MGVDAVSQNLRQLRTGSGGARGAMAALSKFFILCFLVAGLPGSRLPPVKRQGAVLKRWREVGVFGPGSGLAKNGTLNSGNSPHDFASDYRFRHNIFPCGTGQAGLKSWPVTSPKCCGACVWRERETGPTIS